MSDAALELWASRLHPYQRRWVGERATWAVALKARQIGFSHATAAACVFHGLVHRRPQLILSASQDLSDEVLAKVRHHCRVLRSLGYRGAEDYARDKAREVAWRSGGRVVALPANPRTARSFSGDVWLDELAYFQHAQELRDAVFPVASRGSYRVRVCSTPNGAQGLFYELATSPPPGWVVHRVTLEDAQRDGFRADTDKLRALCGGDERLWSQWYGCSFLDAALQYLPTELVDAACEPCTLPDLGDATIHAGLDVGRTSDLTALTILAVVGEHAHTLAVLTCQRSRFAEQRAMLEAARSRFAWDTLTVDATGLGTQLAEELAEEWGDEVRPLVFSARVKEDLFTRLFRWLEGRRLHFGQRDAAPLRGEALALQRIVTDQGTVTYAAPRTAAGHGDRLTSLALALRGAGEPGGPVRMGQRPLFVVA